MRFQPEISAGVSLMRNAFDFTRACWSLGHGCYRRYASVNQDVCSTLLNIKMFAEDAIEFAVLVAPASDFGNSRDRCCQQRLGTLPHLPLLSPTGS